jgi:hypothetical protein
LLGITALDRRADLRLRCFDPAHTQRWQPEIFAGLAGNAQQRPWKYPGLADAHFRFLAQLLPAYLPGPLTQQIFFGAPKPDQLST